MYIHVWFYSVAWFLNTGTAEFKLWSLPVNAGSYFYPILQTNYKLCEGIYHPLSFDLILYIS